MAERKVSIIVQAKNLTKGVFGKVSQGLQAFAGAFKMVAIGAVAAGAAIVGMAAKALKSFAVQEAAEKQLSTALGYTSQALLDQAAALQKATTYGDESIIGVQAQIAAFTKDEDSIKKATEATLDLASATGMDLKAAGALVAKTLGSSTNALSRYGVEVNGAVGSSERLETLTKNIAGVFGGQAAAASQTLSGAYAQLKNNIGDAWEAAGQMITQSSGLQSIIQKLSAKVVEATAKFKAWAQGSGINEMIMKVQLFGNNFSMIFKRIYTVAVGTFKGIADAFLAPFRYIIKVAKVVKQKVSDTFKGIESPPLMEQLKDVSVDVTKSWRETYDKLQKITEDGVAREAAILASFHDKEKKKLQESVDAKKAAAQAGVKIVQDEAAANVKAIEDVAKAKQEAARAAQLEIQEREAATDKQLDFLNQEIDKIKEKANLNIKDFIAAQKEEAKAGDTAKEEEKRRDKINEKLRRGVKLSKKDQEFMDAFKAREQAQNQLAGLQAKADLAKDEKRRLAEAAKNLQLSKRQVTLLEKISIDQQKLLTMK